METFGQFEAFESMKKFGPLEAFRSHLETCESEAFRSLKGITKRDHWRRLDYWKDCVSLEAFG